jgi:hypothetical protein
VSLSASVLDHAAASLDGGAPVTEATLDFGDHPAGAFGTVAAEVHNLGYDAQQAVLALNGAAINGGGGRFSLVGGFSPALVGGTPASCEVAFDDAGATPDSTYTASLVFQSADEPLPGAAPQPDLVVTLRARVVAAPAGAGDPERPAVTRLLAPFPNPIRGAGTLRFELAEAAEARLEIFDLGGRRVALVAERRFEPGRYAFTWDGRGAAGTTAGAGLYFARLSGAGISTHTARFALVR